MKPVYFILSLTMTVTLAYELMYDDTYYESILKNERLFNGLLECLLSDDVCSNPVFQQLKDLSPEIIETICGKCTEKQKMNFKNSTVKFKKDRPVDYDHVLTKYDPENKFRGPLEDFLNS
uniref:Odorant-binding protein A10 n=1 Tax=Cacopsylla melanoneura TaxID=428564 RepID=A0A8D8R743_9HEMI